MRRRSTDAPKWNDARFDVCHVLVGTRSARVHSPVPNRAGQKIQTKKAAEAKSDRTRTVVFDVVASDTDGLQREKTKTTKDKRCSCYTHVMNCHGEASTILKSPACCWSLSIFDILHKFEAPNELTPRLLTIQKPKHQETRVYPHKLFLLT